jgi:hypothetical protein
MIRNILKNTDARQVLFYSNKHGYTGAAVAVALTGDSWGWLTGKRSSR